jgi:hypothetical protein
MERVGHRPNMAASALSDDLNRHKYNAVVLEANGVTSKHSTFESKNNSNVECLDVTLIPRSSGKSIKQHQTMTDPNGP